MQTQLDQRHETDGPKDVDPNDEDTFRIKIWYEDDGAETVVYDNCFDQTIGGGNIQVHQG